MIKGSPPPRKKGKLTVKTGGLYEVVNKLSPNKVNDDEDGYHYADGQNDDD